jgi:hypothetical protein
MNVKVGGLGIGMGNRSTWRKLAPLPLYPQHISHIRELVLVTVIRELVLATVAYQGVSVGHCCISGS